MNEQYDFSKRQDENTFDQLVRVSVDKINKLHKKDWTDIREEFDFEHSSDNLRKYATGFKLMVDNGYVKGKQGDLPKYKEVVELKGDGSQTSDKLIRLSEQDMKSPDKLLLAHGYNPKLFELTNSRSSMWNSGVDNTLYSSRITVKPKVNTGFDIEKLMEAVKKEVKPSELKYSKSDDGVELLAIPFVDLHFGINTKESYNDKLIETLDIIKSKKWDTIYIPFGHDLIHVNNHKNQTASGTQIEAIDLSKAWKDALFFYRNIFDEAIKNSNKVVSHYVCGNHDTDMSWAFAQMLEEIYPQVEFDVAIDNKKYFKWNNILIVNTHGERGMQRIAKTMITKYRDLMVGAKTVEIFSGHLHSERVKDEYGIVVRTLPTSASEDDWHVSQSFEGACKYSQVFVYNKDRLKTIYHV